MPDFPLNFIERLAEQILFFPPKDQKPKALRFCTPTDELGLFAWKMDSKGKMYNESDLFCDRRKENAAASMVRENCKVKIHK